MSVYKGTTLIAGSLPNSANQDLSNLSQTGQAVIDGKADTDLTNVTDTGYIKMAGAGMPSSRYIELTLGASGASYTVPANGWVLLSKQSTADSQYVELGIGNSIRMRGVSVASNSACMAYIPVKKNGRFYAVYTAGGSTQFFRFIYAVGSESEAS